MSYFILAVLLSVLGSSLTFIFNLPVPGSIIGMLLMLVFLGLRRRVPTGLATLSKNLAPYLPLFIVPASVGVVTQKTILFEHGPLLLVIMLVSIIPGALVCGFIMAWQKH